MKLLIHPLTIALCLSLLLTSLNSQALENKVKLITNQKLQAQDHNSTRSNRGSINNTQGDQANNQKPVNNQTIQLIKGRNPQTGKEINRGENNQPNTQDHNSAHSNKDHKKHDKSPNQQKPLNNQTIKQKKGRNPQTGKEINSKKNNITKDSM